MNKVLQFRNGELQHETLAFNLEQLYQVVSGANVVVT